MARSGGHPPLPSPPLTVCISCRGKCSVTLLNETESLKSYLEREVRGGCGGGCPAGLGASPGFLWVQTLPLSNPPPRVPGWDTGLGMTVARTQTTLWLGLWSQRCPGSWGRRAPPTPPPWPQQCLQTACTFLGRRQPAGLCVLRPDWSALELVGDLEGRPVSGAPLSRYTSAPPTASRGGPAGMQLQMGW